MAFQAAWMGYSALMWGMHVGSMTFVRVWPGRVSLNAVALDLGSDVDANEI